MANINHQDLTDPKLHEPKDVATAATGTVYLANGTGSGSWGAVPGAGQNQVTINTASDFPAAVAGVISLEDNTVYQISGSINVGSDRFLLGNQSQIEGSIVSVDSITSSTTGTLFTATTSVTFKNITLSAANGKMFSATGAGALAEIFVVSNVTILTCDTLGTFTNWGLTVFSEFGLLNAATNGINFVGTCGELKTFAATYLDYSGIGIDLGTATFNGIFIGPNVRFSSQVGTTGLDVAPNSANINANLRGFINNTIFEGAGTGTIGLDPSDILWSLANNAGVADTHLGAQGGIIGSALSTTFSGLGSGNSVLVNFGTAFIKDIEDQFTVSTAGRIKYIGKETRLFFVDATLFGSIAGGATRQYVYTVAKNGGQIISSSSKTEYDGSNPGANSVTSLVEMVEDDFIEIKVFAVTATTTLVVDTCSIKILES